MPNTLCDVLNITLSLLSRNVCERLQDEKPNGYCLRWAKELASLKLLNDNLRNASTFLRTAVRDLAICYKNLEEFHKPDSLNVDNTDVDQQLVYYTPDGSKLERELREIKLVEKAKEKFLTAKENFRKCNGECERMCENASPSLPSFQDTIFATKVRVIVAILGNLENLTVASDNCAKILSELHRSTEIRSLRSTGSTTRTKFEMFLQPEKKDNLNSVIDINVVVIKFIKKFFRKPVALFNWQVTMGEANMQVFHQIVDNMSTRIEHNGCKIDTRISAVNCKGEVFTTHKESSALARIADGVCFPFWHLTDEKANELRMPKNIQIISISVDCNGCRVPKHSGELNKDCKNKVYVLATYTSKQETVFVLFVIDVQGKLVHTAELTFLPRRTDEEKIQGAIFCTKDKLIIYDMCEAYLCGRDGELETPLNNGLTLMAASTITDENELIFLKKPGTIHVYSISNDSFLDDQDFDARKEVKALTFNHASNEVILLCKHKPVLLLTAEYHLLRYTKTGELQQNIKLQEFDFTQASLISHPSGPVVLLDSNRLLYLQWNSEKEN